MKVVKRIREEFEINPAKIRVARAIRNLKVSELSTVAKVDRQTIMRIEKDGAQSVTFDVFERLRKALDLPTEFFTDDNFDGVKVE